ncbi:MAG: hypothetical protein JWQ32_2685 [Marmoricola sp.]|nr:hypothetical protein [Marmoricola sp.]
MNRRALRFSAVVGAVALSALAVAPVFAAAPVSQATAQSLQLSIAGNPVVTQLQTVTNDGSTAHEVNSNTIPPLVGIVPANNALAAAVAVQKAGANSDGTSYACAGIAGTGSSGAVNVGTSSCNIDGKPLTLNLGSLNLDLTHLLGGDGAITTALNNALGPVISQLTVPLDGLVAQLVGAINGTPLGKISLSGGLAAVEATCTANPTAAQGHSQILDASGGHTIPISITIPTGTGSATQTLTLVNLDVNLPAKPGGTDVLVHLDAVTQDLIDELTIELDTALGGQIASLDAVTKALLQPLQNALIAPLVTALQPALQAISDNLLKITVNDVTPGDAGRSVSVNTLKLGVLGAGTSLTGSALIGGTIGHVTCGPNRALVGPPSSTPTAPPTGNSKPPTVVDSGFHGASDTTRNVLTATAALMLLAGTAGLIGYRRMLTK